jgi:hypothetical protein
MKFSIGRTGDYLDWTSDKLFWPGDWTGWASTTTTSAGFTTMNGLKWEHRFEVSGLVKEWLKVELKNQWITIFYQPPKDAKRGSFTRATEWSESLFVNEKSVDVRDITARYRNGILLIKCNAPDRSISPAQIPVTE